MDLNYDWLFKMSLFDGFLGHFIIIIIIFFNILKDFSFWTEIPLSDCSAPMKNHAHTADHNYVKISAFNKDLCGEILFNIDSNYVHRTFLGLKAQ